MRNESLELASRQVVRQRDRIERLEAKIEELGIYIKILAVGIISMAMALFLGVL